MAIYVDPNPHPLLRYTVRVEYLHPVTGHVEYEYQYMSEDEFMMSFNASIERCHELINEEIGYLDGWEYKVEKWGLQYILNAFHQNDILSENTISLLKTGDITCPVYKDEDERELALYYLKEIRPRYTKEQVAKAILSVITSKPNVEIVNRILKVWDASLKRDTYVEMQLKMIANSNALDLALGRMLKVNDADNLRRLKTKLELLSTEWNLAQETDAHKRSILLYRFITECPLIARNNISLKDALETVSVFLNLPKTTYTKEVQMTQPVRREVDANLTPVELRKERIYSQINSKWAAFKAQYLK